MFRELLKPGLPVILIRRIKILDFVPTFKSTANDTIKCFDFIFPRPDFRILGSSNTTVQISADIPMLNAPLATREVQATRNHKSLVTIAGCQMWSMKSNRE